VRRAGHGRVALREAQAGGCAVPEQQVE
jgi:hypothetical protein